MTNQDKTVAALILIIIGVAALSNPQCQGGCRTWAGHFVTHGLKVLV